MHRFLLTKRPVFMASVSCALGVATYCHRSKIEDAYIAHWFRPRRVTRTSLEFNVTVLKMQNIVNYVEIKQPRFDLTTQKILEDYLINSSSMILPSAKHLQDLKLEQKRQANEMVRSLVVNHEIETYFLLSIYHMEMFDAFVKLADPNKSGELMDYMWKKRHLANNATFKLWETLGD